MANSQSVKAVAKYIRMSPHKIRRVIDQIRGRSYQEALMILEFLPYDAGGPIWQVVHSAAANAKYNYGLMTDCNSYFELCNTENSIVRSATRYFNVL